MFKTFSTKLLNKLSNRRYYCNVNKSDLNLIDQKINIVDEKINVVANKLDFVFYFFQTFDVHSIAVKVFSLICQYNESFIGLL